MVNESLAAIIYLEVSLLQAAAAASCNPTCMVRNLETFATVG